MSRIVAKALHDPRSVGSAGNVYIELGGAPPSARALEANESLQQTEDLLAAQGVPFPETVLVDDFSLQAWAHRQEIEVHGGFAPDTVPIIYLHEHSHWALFHSIGLDPNYIERQRREIQADWGSGYRAAQIGVEDQLVESGIRQLKSVAGLDHNTSDERAAAVRAGIAAAEAGQDFQWGALEYGNSFVVAKQQPAAPIPSALPAPPSAPSAPPPADQNQQFADWLGAVIG
jgi:hypothetical protein